MDKLLLKQPMMNKVLYSLIPIILFSIFLFGWRVFTVILVSNIAAFITEYLFVHKKKGGKVSMAVFVTATLLALTLPPTIPYWIAVVGVVFGVTFGKMVFGGFGMNVFNPAIVGRTFIYISFPQAMTVSWLKPFSSFPGGFGAYFNKHLLTSATPMINLRITGELISLKSLFFGNISGSMGETSALLIIIAAIYLLITKTARWEAVLSAISGLLVFGFIFNGGNPLYILFSGGAMFGSVFMITDPVSLPKEKISIWIYGVLVAFLTVVIRKYSLFIEGFMFALLLGNTFMPIIEYAVIKLKKQSAKASPVRGK